MAVKWLAKADKKFLELQFSLQKQVDFLENIFLLMEDGITPRDSLRLTVTSGGSIERSVAQRILDLLREGLPLSRGMAGVFRQDVVNAVAAAEQTERFAESGLKVVSILREQFKTRKQVMGKLLRPIPYLAFALGLYALFAAAIWPRFEVVSSPESWHPMAYANYMIGQFIADYWWLFVIVPVTLAVAVRVMLRHWTGAARRVLDRIWPFSLYRNLAAVGVGEYLSVMLAAGHDFRTALVSTASHATPYANLYISRMNHQLRAGYTIPKVLDVGLFTQGDINRLSILAEFQGLHGALIRMSSASRQAVLARLRAMATVLNALGLTAVAMSYALLIVSLYLNATRIQQQMMSL